MDDLNFILGLMAQNTHALGFIPSNTVGQRYLQQGRYLIQTRRGVPIGYLLHGSLRPGGILTIAQQVIEFDYREQGHGMDTVRSLIERAKQNNCRAITLRCAENLAANAFWQAAGFECTNVLRPQNTRRRSVNVYTLDLWPTLWNAA